MKQHPSPSTESSTVDRPSLARRRYAGPDRGVDRRLLRVLLATLCVLIVGRLVVDVLPGGGLALSLVGFGVLLALPFAIVWAVASSLHPVQ